MYSIYWHLDIVTFDLISSCHHSFYPFTTKPAPTNCSILMSILLCYNNYSLISFDSTFISLSLYLSTTYIYTGFRCVEKSLTSTKKKYNDPNKITPQAKYKKNKTPPVYLWIRRNWRDPNPVLNIAMTSGKAKNLNDKIHFPPFAGKKSNKYIKHFFSFSLFFLLLPKVKINLELRYTLYFCFNNFFNLTTSFTNSLSILSETTTHFFHFIFIFSFH